MSLQIFSEVEVLIIREHLLDVPSDPAVMSFDTEVPPRYLRFGFIEREDGSIEPWNTVTTKIPTAILPPDDTTGMRITEGMARIWTCHLVTFHNEPGIRKEGYEPCLRTAPVITETIPSLTNPTTSFGGVSFTLSDPSVRRYFDGTQTVLSTQNTVRVYRKICDARSLIWNGYVDGVTVSPQHEMTVSCRPIMKKFEQLAFFGFEDRAAQWEHNSFRIPIVAARLIPWSARDQEHSAVGCETFSFLMARDKVRSINTQIFNKDYDDSISAVPGIATWVNYSRNIQSYMREPYDFEAQYEASSEYVERAINALFEAQNTAVSNHFENDKTPAYVSFELSDLVPSSITIQNLDEFDVSQGRGRVTFERGIFFGENAEKFDYNRKNYRTGYVPEGALGAGRITPVESPHYEKFFIGTQTIFLNVGTSTSTPNWVYQFAWRIKNSRSGSLAMRGYQHGQDNSSTFPSLSLGDSYCNWTHVPVFLDPVPDVSDPSWQGPWPLPRGTNLVAPRIRYYLPSYSVRRTGGQLDPYGRYGYNHVEGAVAHPLDSFYRWTLEQDKPNAPRSTVVDEPSIYLRAVIYTPHQMQLCFFGRKRDQISLLAREVYFYTQWTTFRTITNYIPAAGVRTDHQAELGLAFVRPGTRGIQIPPNTKEGRYHYVDSIPISGQEGKTWLENGVNPIPAPRCKDMYVTRPSFDQDQSIQTNLLKMLGEDNRPLFVQVDPIHQGGGSSNLRVMSGIPQADPRTITSEPLRRKVRHASPAVVPSEAPRSGGAWYVRASYQSGECDNWDIHPFLNPTAHVNHKKNFRGYYHHDQTLANQGVSPYLFVQAISQAVGFETDWRAEDTTYNEMTLSNPMQLIEDTSQSYQALLSRTLPGLGKILRWNPSKEKTELINWMTIHPSQEREIAAVFDEDCLRFAGVAKAAASTPTSFIFENKDLLRGTSTLEGFSDEHLQMARYQKSTSNIFIQGKGLTIQTGTWWREPQAGIDHYDRMVEVLTRRTQVIDFTVPNEILIRLGELGTISVGKWVRVISPGVPRGIGDVFVTDTVQTESETRYKGYFFLGVGIDNISENELKPAPPITPRDVPGDTFPPLDERTTDGESAQTRIDY